MRPSPRPVNANPIPTQVGEDTYPPEFGRTLQEYTTGDIKLSMWIPSDFVGRIIGKKGSVVAGLQRETKVESITALPPVGNSLWTAVVIIGELRPIFAACGEVTKLVDNEVDGVVVEFMINYKKPFFLYGSRKDSTIKRISAESNTRIYFPEFDPKKQSFKDLEPFTLEGTKEDCQRAVELLEREATSYQQYQTNRLAKQAAEGGTVSPVPAGPPGIPVAMHQQQSQFAPQRVASERVPKHRQTEDMHQTVFNAAGAGPRPGRGESGDARRLPRTEAPAEPSAAAAAQPHTAPGAVPRQPRPAPVEGGGSNIIDKLIQAKRESAKNNFVPERRSERVAPAGPPGLTEGEATGGPKLSPEELAAKYPTVSQIMDVPTNLVGLLLSRRPQSRVTTINIIQTMTHTIISKMPPSGDKVVAALAARGQPASAESSAAIPGESDDGSDSESEGEEVTDPRYATLSTKERKARMIADSEMLGYVTFRVTAYNMENVDMVVDALRKIIKGDRISEVIENMRGPARNLPWPPAATREAARERRAEKKAKHTTEHGEYPEREYRPRGDRFGGRGGGSGGRGGRGGWRGGRGGGRGSRDEEDAIGNAGSISAHIAEATGAAGARGSGRGGGRGGNF